MNNQSNRKWYIIGGVVILVGILVLWSYLAGRNKSPFETVKVTRGNITEEVSATGNVKPVKSVDLAFEKIGRIAAVNANVGDTVYAGEAVVVLDKSDLQTQLAKAQADLATGNANLEKAKIDLGNYYGDAINILSNAYAASDDAVRTKTSSLFSGSQTSGLSADVHPVR